MNRKLILALGLFVSMTALSQKKITLEDGVLQQNRNFRADKLMVSNGFPLPIITFTSPIRAKS
jgi:hypothetical protein